MVIPSISSNRMILKGMSPILELDAISLMRVLTVSSFLSSEALISKKFSSFSSPRRSFANAPAAAVLPVPATPNNSMFGMSPLTTQERASLTNLSCPMISVIDFGLYFSVHSIFIHLFILIVVVSIDHNSPYLSYVLLHP